MFTPAEIVDACKAAAAAGDTDYSRVFTIAHSGRSAGAAHYVDLTARVGSKEGRLWLKFVDEKFSGKIAPLPGMGDPGIIGSEAPPGQVRPFELSAKLVVDRQHCFVEK